MKQSTVRLAPAVPIIWLVEYVAMLRKTLEIKIDERATDKEKAQAAIIDRRIAKRIESIQSYLDRLNQTQLN